MIEKTIKSCCFFVVIVVVLSIQCSSPQQLSPCKCPIEEGFMLMKGQVQVYSGNANKDDFEKDDIIKIEGNAEVDFEKALKKLPEGKASVKVVFPKGENNEKNLVIYELHPGTPDNYTKFFFFYCMKFHNYVDNSCHVPAEYKTQFDQEVSKKYEELFFHSMSNGKDKDNHKYVDIYEHPTLPRLLGTNCQGKSIFITEEEVRNIMNNMSFVEKNLLTIDIAEKNIKLICNESEHPNKEIKLLNALYYKYIVKYNLQGKSEFEIRTMLGY